MVRLLTDGLAVGPRLTVVVRDFLDVSPPVAVRELFPDEVHIWKCFLRTSMATLDASFELLSNGELERASRFRSDVTRLKFVLTRAALRSLLSSYLNILPRDVSFRYSEYGKPHLDGTLDLHFNLSHTEDLALIAFARKHEIGIDVERIQPELDSRSLMRRFFWAEGQQPLDCLSREELTLRFFQCWTRNEAFVKARGENLTFSSELFRTLSKGDGFGAVLVAEDSPVENRTWTLQNLPIGSEYAAALAVQSRSKN